jgi:hypothetical protein
VGLAVDLIDGHGVTCLHIVNGDPTPQDMRCLENALNLEYFQYVELNYNYSISIKFNEHSFHMFLCTSSWRLLN